MSTRAYITGFGSHLPGPPIANDAIEAHIGQVNGRPSTVGARALRWNGIETRHYALDAAGAPFSDNAEMAAHAVGAAVRDVGDVDGRGLDFLATATTQGDFLVPGHACAVHAALSEPAVEDGAGVNAPALEIASFQSVCASAMLAMRAADLRVRAGETRRAAVVGSEFASRWFRPSFYEDTNLVDAKGRVRLEADFLRFTLSDGAGAVLVEPAPRPGRLAFRIEWIDLISYADRFDTCMWAGASAQTRFDRTSTWSFLGPREAAREGAIALQQDFALLKPIIRSWVARYLELVEDGRIDPAALTHVVCHYSARSLRDEIVTLLRAAGALPPLERWFSNLATCGNTGAAAIFILLEEFRRTRAIKPGDTILCVVPESGRAMVGFMMLTAVEGDAHDAP